MREREKYKNLTAVLYEIYNLPENEKVIAILYFFTLMKIEKPELTIKCLMHIFRDIWKNSETCWKNILCTIIFFISHSQHIRSLWDALRIRSQEEKKNNKTKRTEPKLARFLVRLNISKIAETSLREQDEDMHVRRFTEKYFAHTIAASLFQFLSFTFLFLFLFGFSLYLVLFSICSRIYARKFTLKRLKRPRIPLWTAVAVHWIFHFGKTKRKQGNTHDCFAIQFLSMVLKFFDQTRI